MTTPQAIPPRIRRALIMMMQEYVYPADLVGGLATSRGFVTLGDLVEAIEYGLSRGAALAFVEMMDPGPTEHAYSRPGMDQSRREFRKETLALEVPERVLMALPDEWFGESVRVAYDRAVQIGFDALGPSEVVGAFETRVNQLCLQNGVPYQMKDGELARVGDPDLATAAVQPAIGVLGDARMTDANRHFQKALDDHQASDPEDAIDEARQAVEAALLAVLDDRGIERPDRHQAQSLFDALVSAGLVERDVEELILAAPRVRGRTRAGHAGRRPIEPNESEPVIAAAASSIVYLGRLLTG